MAIISCSITQIKPLPKIRKEVLSRIRKVCRAVEFETGIIIDSFCFSGSRTSPYFDPQKSDLDFRVSFRGVLVEKPVKPCAPVRKPRNGRVRLTPRKTPEEKFCKMLEKGFKKALKVKDCDVFLAFDPNSKVQAKEENWELESLTAPEKTQIIRAPLYDILKNKWVTPPYKVKWRGKICASIKKWKDGTSSIRKLQPSMDPKLWEQSK